MGPASLNHLPIELHTSILTFLLSISREPPPLSQRELRRLATGRPSKRPPPTRPVKLNWIEQDIRSPLIFPYNIAWVCKLWRNLIAKIPGCWTRVVFDVANDPTPFLNTFLWSKNLQRLEVFVFNSSSNAKVVDKSRENGRVSAIAQALEPHIHRCKSIIFDIVYSSSLPPPNIYFLHASSHLEDLTLDCRVDDIDVRKNAYATPRAEDRTRFRKFPKLMKLSLTGFWFMYLAMHAHKPKKLLENLTIKEVPMDLYISHFKFRHAGRYTLPKFASYLSIAAPRSIYFRDLSLSYAYEISETAPEAPVPWGNIHFQSVSKDFLGHLNAAINISTQPQYHGLPLLFDRCEIPSMRHIRQRRRLTLKNIIDRQSLRNIFESWCRPATGSSFDIDSCPAFNDDFLSWLESNLEDDDRITCISIRDCEDFSPGALQHYIDALHDVDFRRGEGGGLGLMELLVEGKGPVLAKEDRIWFDENSNFVNVNWTTTNDEGICEVYGSYKMRPYESMASDSD